MNNSIIIIGALIFLSSLVCAIEKYFPNRISAIILIGAGMALSSLLIIDSVHFFLFLVALGAGYGTDFLGVYTGKWHYHTKSGYSLWVGTGWAVLTLFIFHSAVLITIPAVVFLTVIALLIVSSKFHPRELQGSTDFVFLVAKTSLIAVAPIIFLLSFSLGIIIEFFAVELIGAWKYKHISYINIGTGYGAFMVYITIIQKQLTTGNGPVLFHLAWILPAFYITIMLTPYLHKFSRGTLSNFLKLTIFQSKRKKNTQ